MRSDLSAFATNFGKKWLDKGEIIFEYQYVLSGYISITIKISPPLFLNISKVPIAEQCVCFIKIRVKRA